MVTLLAVVLAPKRTFFVPVNEQKPFSDAHLVHEVDDDVDVPALPLEPELELEPELVLLDDGLPYQQLFA
ncbi:hypothetical protein [Trinickia terrae]|uniref:hypothetical protein n=1 Tax=Trinickia terrae TaxID=2571161 RepID=UPI00146C31CC|nr:hypothetical protein [Trinickia terrae]